MILCCLTNGCGCNKLPRIINPHVLGPRSEVRKHNLSSVFLKNHEPHHMKKWFLHFFPWHRCHSTIHAGRSTASSSTGPRPSAWSDVHSVAPASSARKGWRWRRKNCGKAGWQLGPRGWVNWEGFDLWKYMEHILYIEIVGNMCI